MAIQIEIMIIAALVSLGLLGGGAALIRAIIMARRSSHHLATRSTDPVPPSVDIRPPE